MSVLRRNQGWMSGGSTTPRRASHRNEPAKLGFELRDHEFQHPDRFVIWMANFFQNRVESGALSF